MLVVLSCPARGWNALGKKKKSAVESPLRLRLATDTLIPCFCCRDGMFGSNCGQTVDT